MADQRALEGDASSCEGDPEPVTEPPAFFADLVRDISAHLPESVYPPSDDTFLVLQTLLDDAAELRRRRPSVCVEVGSGSGALLTGLALALNNGQVAAPESVDPDEAATTVLGPVAAGAVAAPAPPFDSHGNSECSGALQPPPPPPPPPPAHSGSGRLGEGSADGGASDGETAVNLNSSAAAGCVFLAVDKNPNAVRMTRRTLRQHGVTTGECVRTSLLAQTRLRGAIDVLLFNPPYVVTPEEEMAGCGISISWAGGADGRQVVDQFLPQVPLVLSKPLGVFYLVGIEENRPDEIVATMRERFGLCGSYCQRQTCGIERLFVLKFTWARIDPGRRTGESTECTEE